MEPSDSDNSGLEPLFGKGNEFIVNRTQPFFLFQAIFVNLFVVCTCSENTGPPHQINNLTFVYVRYKRFYSFFSDT